VSPKFGKPAARRGRKASGLTVDATSADSGVAGRSDALVSPSVTVRLLRHLRGGTDSAAASPVEPLTDREIAVARLVAEGKTNAEIGAELFISAGTVKTHVANIQRKLGARNRVGIAVWAWNSGHVRP
jgi:DNA-binding NarL/FixJ family response regulator